jgi:hypothetical protein
MITGICHATKGCMNVGSFTIWDWVKGGDVGFVSMAGKQWAHWQHVGAAATMGEVTTAGSLAVLAVVAVAQAVINPGG